MNTIYTVMLCRQHPRIEHLKISKMAKSAESHLPNSEEIVPKILVNFKDVCLVHDRQKSPTQCKLP